MTHGNGEHWEETEEREAAEAGDRRETREYWRRVERGIEHPMRVSMLFIKYSPGDTQLLVTVVHDHKAREGGFLPASGPCWRWMPLSELDRSYFGYRKHSRRSSPSDLSPTGRQYRSILKRIQRKMTHGCCTLTVFPYVCPALVRERLASEGFKIDIGADDDIHGCVTIAWFSTSAGPAPNYYDYPGVGYPEADAVEPAR